MKKLVYILFFMLSVTTIYSQINLVSNPSFENYSSCPDNAGQVNKAIGWSSFFNSPDYFHTCATVSQFEVPQNFFGYQFSASGNAYCGLITYDLNDPLYREVIGTQLVSNLVPFQKYYISVKVNRADSNFVVGYSTNNLGVKFFTTQPITITINNTAHFYTNTVINDTINWTSLFGSFIADSAYQYLAIGNFFDDNNSIIINDSNGPYAYYFVDDICVSTDSSFTYNYIYTGISENLNDNKISIYPNPSFGEVFITSKTQIESLKIFSALGKIVHESVSKNQYEFQLNLSELSSGIYFIQLKSNKIIRTKKLIINH